MIKWDILNFGHLLTGETSISSTPQLVPIYHIDAQEPFMTSESQPLGLMSHPKDGTIFTA